MILLVSSSAGLLPHSYYPDAPDAVKNRVPPQSDKALHFLSFFALTSTFYFILDGPRRRVLHITLVVCTLCLAVGSEVVQGLLPIDRAFDYFDIVANVLGSLIAVGLCNLYHKRSAERKRKAKYSALAGEGLDEGDLELGEGSGLGLTTDELGRQPGPAGQEIGVVSTSPQAKTVEEELDNWDENVPDDEWEEDEDGPGKDTKMTPATSSVGSEEVPMKISEKVAVD